MLLANSTNKTISTGRLEYYTVYEFKVAGKTVIGQGPFSSPTDIRTDAYGMYSYIAFAAKVLCGLMVCALTFCAEGVWFESNGCNPRKCVANRAKFIHLPYQLFSVRILDSLENQMQEIYQ